MDVSRSSFDDADSASEFETDPLRLKQILVNLVGNAIKFTSNGRRATPRLYQMRRAVRSHYVRRFRDTGIGMDDPHKCKTVPPFSQADDSTTRRFGGTGLGLTISKRLAELLGGDITVEANVGIGSAFTVEINAGSLKDVKMLSGLAEAIAPMPANSRFPTKVTLNGRILLAEDGLDNQRLISTHLRKAGAEVTIAPNGQIASTWSRQKNSISS